MHPVVIELSNEDITIMHLAFYEYRDILKKNKNLCKNKKCERLKGVSRMITLVDLLL